MAGPATGREREILAVASAHLNTMGVSVEWFSDIADTLGLTRPALYNYFADREDLQFRCYLMACDELGQRFDMAQASHEDAVDILTGFLAINLSAAPELAVMSELAALRPEQRDAVAARQDALVTRIADEIRRGIDAGRIRDLDARLLARTLLGLASWPALLSRWGSPADRTLLARGIRSFLLRGLATRPEEAVPLPEPLAPLARVRPDLFSRADISAARRESVLIAASALFNTRGIGATRVDDVAERLGLSKRIVYHHVGQKQDLVDACVERAYGYSATLMSAAEAFEGPRAQALTTAIRDIVLANSDPAACVMVPYVGYGQVGAAERAAVRDHVARMIDGYRTLIAAGIAEGSVRPIDIEAAQLALPGLFCWSANAPDQSAEEVARRAELLASIAARGILA
ncbi:MAG: TetR family transcriptional regulator [Phenylobacterium sp.]